MRVLNPHMVLDKASRIEDDATDLQTKLSDLDEEKYADDIATLAGIICNAIDLRSYAESDRELLPTEYLKAGYIEGFVKWLQREEGHTLPPGMQLVGQGLRAMGIEVEGLQQVAARVFAESQKGRREV